MGRLAWCRMSRRKKGKQAARAAPQREIPPESRRRMLILGIALIVGSVLGVVVGIIYFATHRTPIDLGTLNAVPTSEFFSDKDLYATYAGAASCRECHAKEFDAWERH